MSNTPIPKKPFLSPAYVFMAVWLLVSILYALKLSRLFIFNLSEVAMLIAAILTPCIICILIGSFIKIRKISSINITSSLLNKNKILIALWVSCTLVEVVYSQGIPLLWKMQGLSKTYFDFGIPSIHGLLNSLGLALSAVNFFIFIKLGNKKYLVFPVFLIVWGVVVISRNLVLVNFVQILFIYVLFRKVSLRQYTVPALMILVMTLGFGVLGDYRTGRQEFYALALLTFEYPEWAPSGLIWGYIYLTTPLNNLLNTIASVAPRYDPALPSTLSLLFPSVIRDYIYGAENLIHTALVSQAFNVSSAFIGPYIDMGFVGIIIYVTAISSLITFTWKLASKPFGILSCAVLWQCAFFSVFYNHFFYLPIIFQIFWLYIIFRIKS